MEHNRFRAWRFVHPDLDTDRSGLTTDVSGSISMTSEVASVQQSIKLLLTTRLGERVMRPGYGCQLSDLAFASNDDTTAGLAIHYVRQAIRRWEPRVDILDLDAVRDSGAPGRLEVVLDYRVKPHLIRQQLRLPLNLLQPES